MGKSIPKIGTGPASLLAFHLALALFVLLYIFLLLPSNIDSGDFPAAYLAVAPQSLGALVTTTVVWLVILLASAAYTLSQRRHILRDSVDLYIMCLSYGTVCILALIPLTFASFAYSDLAEGGLQFPDYASPVIGLFGLVIIAAALTRLAMLNRRRSRVTQREMYPH